MKIGTFFTAITAMMAVAFSSFAGSTNVFEKCSPHFPTSTPILWQAPINHLPNSFWIYKKMPRVFSATTISNAIVLASFQDKGFPKPSTNEIVFSVVRFEGEPDPPYFAIYPDWGQITYNLRDRAPDSTEKVANDAAAVQRAWNCLVKLGVDQTQFVKINVASPGGWGVFFPRLVDGVQTYHDQSDGFSFQVFGRQAKIRCFSITLPNLERLSNSPAATLQQIITCIRGQRVVVLPMDDGSPYFAGVKRLAKAKKFTITKITPYYGDGVFGEEPTNNATEPPKILTPIAELEAVADFGTSNVTVRLITPILASDTKRLLSR